MNIQTAVVGAADRYSTFARVITSVGAVYWVATLQGLWTILAVLFADDRHARLALYVNTGFSALTYMQLKARDYLKLTGRNLPPAAEPDDGQNSGV